MGGKHKQANRTKNNARPSSSSHSAELLGNTIPTFFGFTAVKDGVLAVPGFPSDETSCSIHSDFQIQLKQMNKKDPTTRFKALQIFTELCNTLDVNSVKTILPLWSRMYCTLCTDINHKVREASHHAHKAVVSKVKKMIAPYLKELAGPWFTSQYDTYAPAASAATHAFEEAFPSTKLNKAIIFCQEEILLYIFDNLVNQTPQTLCNPNTTSPEDMQAKYERTIIASLQGYTLYLEKLSPEQIKEAKESNKKIISNSKFWKYSKNKVPLIRSCFFHVLIATCQKAKFLLDGESSKLSSAIFNNLDETDAVVLHAVWDAALNVLVNIEDCWSHINIEKQVFGKLYLILKGGGRNISTIYPNVLPLLSKIPEDMIKNKENFYENLFDSMRTRLEVSNYNQTPSEVKIIATTFIECLKYIIIRNSKDIDFCVNLIEKQLIPALEKKLSGSGKKAMSLPFLTQTAFLVYFWHSNCSLDNLANEKLLETFFSSLYSSYNNILTTEASQTSISNILNNQIDFLAILLNPYQYTPKSKGRVKFEEENLEAEEVELINKETNCDFSEVVLSFVKKVVVLYFKNAIHNQDRGYIPAISKIVHLFDAKIIFEEMVIAVNESTCFKLFSSYFSKWLMNEEMKCGELVDLSFSLLKFVTSDEKEYILEEFCNTWFSDSLQYNVCKALSNFSEDECIIKWVRRDKFSKCILNLTERFVTGDGEDMTPLDVIILMLKAKRSNGEFFIESCTSFEIVNIISKALGETHKPHVIELSQDLILNAKTENLSETCVESLVASLFKLWCFKPEDEKLSKACKTGLQIAIDNSKNHQKEYEFTKKLSSVIEDIILCDGIKFSLEQIILNLNTYIELAVNTNLSDCCSSNLEISKALELVKLFIKRETKWEKEMKMIEKLCKIGFEGNGDIDLDYLKLENYLDSKTKMANEKILFEVDLIQKYTNWYLYVGSVLNMIAAAHPRTYKTSVIAHNCNIYAVEGNKEEIYDEDVIPIKISKEEEVKLKSDLELIESVFHESEYNEVNNIESILDVVYGFLLTVGLLESFNTYYASTKHFKKLKPSTTKLKVIASDLLKNVNFVEYNYIYNHCLDTVKKQSVWWLVKTTLKEIFNRNFMRNPIAPPFKSDLPQDCFEELKSMDIGKLPMLKGNYLKILCMVESDFCHQFKEDQWDQIFVFIHKFFEDFVDKSYISEDNITTLSVISRLYLKLRNLFKKNHMKAVEKRIPPETCLAWNEIVQTEVYNKFLLVWRKLAKICYNQHEISPVWVIVLQNVGDVVILGLDLRKCENLSESVELELECGKFMTSPHAVIQITSFHLCVSAIPDLVKLDTEIFGKHVTQMFQDTKEGSSLFKKNSNSDWTAKNLTEEFLKNQGIVEILLSDFFVGDCCTVEPFTDSFTYTYSYLLLWCFLLDMCGEAHAPLRFQYGCWLHDAGYSTIFLESVFKLMPLAVLHGAEAKENFQRHFETLGSLDFREPVTSEKIEQIACYVYRLFLQRLPNVVRDWWNQSENKTSSLVDKVTKLYVSPVLISNELKNVQQDKETGFDNLEVKTYPGSREVVATYTIDEVKMDLIMTLPPNFPLGTIKIESSNVVVSTSNWRNWLFHITKYLIHQNGTIWDALVIWKNNLDKKFEGVEECYICFSILQGSTFEIPRLCCHTCKKKFHSNCLYKWFSTSNKSTCPICRNLF